MKYTYISQSLHAAKESAPTNACFWFHIEDPTFFLFLVLGFWERVSWLQCIEFIMQIRLASNSQGSIYLSPLNTDIKGMCHSTKNPYFQSCSTWFHLFMEKLYFHVPSDLLKNNFPILIFIVYQLYFDYYNYCFSYFIGIHIRLWFLPCPPCNLRTSSSLHNCVLTVHDLAEPDKDGDQNSTVNIKTANGQCSALLTE